MTKDYIKKVYEFLFHEDREWQHEGATQYFDGVLIHYADFMKAKRGEL